MTTRRWVVGVQFLASFCAACATSKPPPRTGAADLAPVIADALDQQLAATTAKLEAEGMRRGALSERGFLPSGARVAYPIHLERDQCAVFVSLASTGMVDLDASLFTVEGAPLIEDDSTGTRPVLTFCAANDAAIDGYYTLHAYQGAGAFVAAQFVRTRRSDDDLRTATGGDRTASALGQLAQTLHERGFEDVAPRASVPVGPAPVRVAVPVDAGQCYTLAAEASLGVSELSLRLVDASGNELANSVGEPALAALQYCASERGELALELAAKKGQGTAQVGRFHAAQATVGGARSLWLGEPVPSAAAWASAKQGVTPPSEKLGPLVLTQRVPLHQGEVFELAHKAPQASCELWEAELAPGLSRATLRVEDDRGELLAEADSDRMRACAIVCGSAGTHRITLLGRVGFGSVVLSARRFARPSEPGDLVFRSPACHGSSGRVEAR